MTFQVINDSNILLFLLTYVKYLNYQSLNYSVK